MQRSGRVASRGARRQRKCCCDHRDLSSGLDPRTAGSTPQGEGWGLTGRFLGLGELLEVLEDVIGRAVAGGLRKEIGDLVVDLVVFKGDARRQQALR